MVWRFAARTTLLLLLVAGCSERQFDLAVETAVFRNQVCACDSLACAGKSALSMVRIHARLSAHLEQALERNPLGLITERDAVVSNMQMASLCIWDLEAREDRADTLGDKELGLDAWKQPDVSQPVVPVPARHTVPRD